MTDVAVVQNWLPEWRKVWAWFAQEYFGMERYQRDMIYQEARKEGKGHEEAFKLAIDCPKADLPKMMFVVQRDE